MNRDDQDQLILLIAIAIIGLAMLVLWNMPPEPVP